MEDRQFVEAPEAAESSRRDTDTKSPRIGGLSLKQELRSMFSCLSLHYQSLAKDMGFIQLAMCVMVFALNL